MKRLVICFTGTRTTFSQHVQKYAIITGDDLGHTAHTAGTPCSIVERIGTGVVRQPMMVQQPTQGPQRTTILPHECLAKFRNPSFRPGYVPHEKELTSFMKKVLSPGDAVIAMEEWIRDYPEAIDVIVYSCFLSRLRSQPMLAWEWFEKMRDLNITPNHITLSSMISGAPTAKAAVRSMESFLVDYPDEVKRHPACFNALLSRLREGDYAKMQHWWQEMRKRNIWPDEFTLSTMMASNRLMESFLEDYPDTATRHPNCFNALLARLRHEAIMSTCNIGGRRCASAISPPMYSPCRQ